MTVIAGITLLHHYQIVNRAVSCVIDDISCVNCNPTSRFYNSPSSRLSAPCRDFGRRAVSGRDMDGNNPGYYHYIPKGQFPVPITTGDVGGFPVSYSPQPPSCLYETKPQIHNDDPAGYGPASGIPVVDGRGDDGLAIPQHYGQMHGANIPMHSPTVPQDLSRPVALAQQVCSQSQQCDGLTMNSISTQQPNYRMHGLSAAHHQAANGGQGHIHGQVAHQPLYTMASDYPMPTAKMSKNQNHNQNLPFPWMKTTKSHAHMWKANWPGRAHSCFLS